VHDWRDRPLRKNECRLSGDARPACETAQVGSHADATHEVTVCFSKASMLSGRAGLAGQFPPLASCQHCVSASPIERWLSGIAYFWLEDVIWRKAIMGDPAAETAAFA
jgi:hypothetical protein